MTRESNHTRSSQSLQLSAERDCCSFGYSSRRNAGPHLRPFNAGCCCEDIGFSLARSASYIYIWLFCMFRSSLRTSEWLGVLDPAKLHLDSPVIRLNPRWWVGLEIDTNHFIFQKYLEDKLSFVFSEICGGDDCQLKLFFRFCFFSEKHDNLGFRCLAHPMFKAAGEKGTQSPFCRNCILKPFQFKMCSFSEPIFKMER